MTWEVTTYDGIELPVMKILHERNQVLSFSIQHLPKDCHEWLGKLLVRQLEKLVTTTTNKTKNEYQTALRKLAGL